MLLYPLTMAVALAYFAEHYFVDAFAGWAIVGGSFWMWNRIEKRLDVRRRAPAPPDDQDTDDDQDSGDGVGTGQAGVAGRRGLTDDELTSSRV